MDWLSFASGGGAVLAFLFVTDLIWAAVGRLIGAQKLDAEFKRLTAENEKLRHIIEDRQRWQKEAETYIASAAAYLREVERVAEGDVILPGEHAVIKN